VYRALLYDVLVSTRVAWMYDRFILTRSDHVYGCPHPKLEDWNATYLPEGEDWGGVTDRYIICPRKDFLRAIDMKRIICEADSWGPKLASKDNFEQLLGAFLADQGITFARFPRNMFNIRVYGDPSRWSIGTDVQGLLSRYGVMVKYLAELQLTEQTCQLSGAEMIQPYV